MGLLDTSRGGRRLSGGLGRELLSGGLSSGRLSGGLLEEENDRKGQKGQTCSGRDDDDDADEYEAAESVPWFGPL